MTGRMETELRFTMKVEKMLESMPKYMMEWYNHLDSNNCNSRTCMEYIKRAYDYMQYISEKLDTNDINLENTQKYMRHMRYKIVNGEQKETSFSYKQFTWSCLNNFFKFLKSNNYIPQNYMENIARPKGSDLVRINKNRKKIGKEEINTLLETLKINLELNAKDSGWGRLVVRDTAMIYLLISTGMRETALTEININDINFNERTLLIIDKGHKEHSYYLNDETLKAINAWLEVRGVFESEALFVSKNGKRILAHNVREILYKYTKEAYGEKISPHKLRAAYCSILYDKTHDIEFVRRAVGHSNIATTQRYIVTDSEEKKKASEILQEILA